MSAFVIAIREKTHDAAELAAYRAAARDARGDHKLQVRVANGQQRVLEGAPVEGVVILEFPSMDEAQAWYDSPAYQSAREHRLKGGDYRFLIVEGV
ncbi:MAG: DUF1330 domain-containing protein [Hyphomonadaceae bacterium]|nr:DUF1330 domain-containing protein [Hyphomonadaceae bacterium]